MSTGIDATKLKEIRKLEQSNANNADDWKKYDKRIREAVDEKMKQREKAGLDTSGNLSNKITTKMNIGGTKESTITGAAERLSQEMNQTLGENAVSYTHTTTPFSVAFNGDENEGILMKIIKFFMRLFGLFGSGNGAEMHGYPGEIQLDTSKEYQIVGINKDMHSTAVMVDNVNQLVVGYDPNGNFNKESFYSLLTPEDRAHLSGYTFINANSENKNKGTFTGMCGVLTTDWIEQELKQKLDERRKGITKYDNLNQAYAHYAIVNQRNNPNVDRMMARNRVHFLMSKEDNIETLEQYDKKCKEQEDKCRQNTANISVNQQTNVQNNKKSTGMMICGIQKTNSNSMLSANVAKANVQNYQSKGL